MSRFGEADKCFRIMDFYKSPPVPDEPGEYVDYESMMPHDKMMPVDFKFSQLSILQDLVDERKAGELPRGPTEYHETLEIILMRAESPEEFYFVLDKRFSIKSEMDKEMKSFFLESIGNEPPPGLSYLIPPKMAKEGMAVVAFSDPGADQPMIRAYIRKPIDEQRCVVWNVDDASSAAVYKKNLHFVPKWLAEYPAFAYRGKLTGVLPFGGAKARWSSKEASIFRDVCKDTDGFILKAVVRYFTKDGKAALYMKTTKGVWVDEEMIFRRAAVKDPTVFEELPDRVSGEESEEAAVIEERFMNLPHPRLWDTPIPNGGDDKDDDLWSRWK